MLEEVNRKNVKLLEEKLKVFDWQRKTKETFQSFGGPSVFFYEECLRASKDDFLGRDHIRMIYATLAAWGMHRMGENVKVKLHNFSDFEESLDKRKDFFKEFKDKNISAFDDFDFIWNEGKELKVSTSNTSLVANSKALHLILPNLIPPIDRQYTLRFFFQDKDFWFKDGQYKNGRMMRKYSPSPLFEKNKEGDYFQKICKEYQGLSSSIPPDIENPVKMMDNTLITIIRHYKNN